VAGAIVLAGAGVWHWRRVRVPSAASRR
jgi:hypothetical protein